MNPEHREREIGGNLAVVRGRIAAACDAAGRNPDGITVIAVTKTRPSADVRTLARLGITDIGENRDQEAAPKAKECGDLPLTWHFVGQLQTNKVRSVAAYADVIHSVDRPRLVTALAREAARAGRKLRCLVQVSLDGVPERGGAAPGGVLPVADAIAEAGCLELGGVMAVAPLGGDPAAAYAELAKVAAKVTEAHPGANIVSAGMSGDLEEAIAFGATHLRIGTALLGGRRPIVR